MLVFGKSEEKYKIYSDIKYKIYIARSTMRHMFVSQMSGPSTWMAQLMKMCPNSVLKSNCVSQGPGGSE